MRYVGSKNRISKELAPIIQSHVDKGVVGYLEPFVGGGIWLTKLTMKTDMAVTFMRN